MKKTGQALARILPRAQAIYSSPLVRTTQTALWVAKAYRLRVEVTSKEVLRPGTPSQELLAFVRSLKGRRLILVGHEPGLTEIMRTLTGIDVPIEIRPGGVFGIRLAPDGSGSLEWALPAPILRKIAD